MHKMKTIFTMGPKFWNELPTNIKNAKIGTV